MQNNIRLGIWLMCATSFVFAVQDGISRHLAAEYNVLMIVMIRYWFFAAFVIAIAIRTQGSIRVAAATSQPFLQITRGLLLAAEICVMVFAFVKLGLIESHAIFASYPLLVANLGRNRRLATLDSHRNRLCRRACDFATGRRSIFTLRSYPPDIGNFICDLRPAHPLCSTAR